MNSFNFVSAFPRDLNYYYINNYRPNISLFMKPIPINIFQEVSTKIKYCVISVDNWLRQNCSHNLVRLIYLFIIYLLI